MTTDELVNEAQRLGVVLQAREDRLHVEARLGTVTPEFRSELVRHKSALLVLLAPVTQFATLKGGLVLPLPVIALALALEDRGYRLSPDSRDGIVVEPTATLTDADRAGIHRWRWHLAALVAYDADAHRGVQ